MTYLGLSVCLCVRGGMLWTLSTCLWYDFLRDLNDSPIDEPPVMVFISPIALCGRIGMWSSSLWEPSCWPLFPSLNLLEFPFFMNFCNFPFCISYSICSFKSLQFSTILLQVFMYFYALKSISTIVLRGFFTREITNSLDFNLALKAVSYTLSSTSSTSKVPQVKRVTYDLTVSFSPCLMVNKWSTSLFGRCPPMKWWRKELPSCSKLSMDDVGSLVNHSLAAPLRVVGKKRYSISSGGC